MLSWRRFAFCRDSIAFFRSSSISFLKNAILPVHKISHYMPPNISVYEEIVDNPEITMDTQTCTHSEASTLSSSSNAVALNDDDTTEAFESTCTKVQCDNYDQQTLCTELNTQVCTTSKKVSKPNMGEKYLTALARH